MANRTPGRVARALVQQMDPYDYARDSDGNTPLYKKDQIIDVLTNALQHVLAPDVLQAATQLAKRTGGEGKLACALLAVSDLGRKGLLGRFRGVHAKTDG